MNTYKNKLDVKGATLASVMNVSSNDSQSQINNAPKKENFIAWLKVFAEKLGDYMPDEEAIILPYLKFEGVYLEYKQEKARQKEDYCHYSYSCCIFNEDISNIRLVQQKGSFVCCKV